MAHRLLWMHYDKPPEKCSELVGKECTHTTYSIKVKVLALYLTVGHVRATNEEKLGDVPAMGVPTFMFEILNGDGKGQVLLMGAGTFLEFFTVDA